MDSPGQPNSIARWPQFEQFFCSFRLFGTPSDVDVVAVVQLPNWFVSDADGLRIHAIGTGRICGSVDIERKSKWVGVFQPHMPPEFIIVQARLSDFSKFTRGADGALRTSRDLRFELVDEFGRPIAEGFDFSWYGSTSLPLPARENIIRVAGDVGVDGFLFGGATWHARLERLVRRYLGCDSARLERILDWGVGCGRVARHFLERGQVNIHGADIDKLNIDWLHDNFNWSNAIRVDFDPPMPYPDAYFDVVYGHSVFTHLSYEDHFKWIHEINRILKPGGFAFLTVCTEPGLYLTRHKDLSRFDMESYFRVGFIDIESQSRFGVDTGREGYYRLVSQTRQFILQQWGKLFTIRRIIPCCMEHLDLVIVQKTSPERTL